ncbi:MAG TPA: two-component regulator propeller domain-containing protein, partial [Parafilimonas sp.]
DKYVFQHLTVEDGLIANSRVTTFQDEEGFYWFADVNGIQRFDGKNFTNYKFSYNPFKLIKNDDRINIAAEDNEKNIWLINKEGINIFYRRQNKLSRLYMSDAADSNINNVASVIKDKQHNLWIITGKSIFIYNYTLHKPVLYSRIIFDDKPGIQQALYDAAKNCFWLLIGSPKRIACFNFKTNQLSYPVKQTVDEMFGTSVLISFFKLDASENLWIAGYGGEFGRYNIPLNKTTIYNILHERNSQVIGAPNSTITDAIDDGNGLIWFGSDYHLGLLRYDKASGKFFQQENNNGSEYGFHYNEIVYDFFQDNEKNIWVDTDLGMNIFNPQAQVFKYLNPKPGSFVTQFSADVSSIFQSSCGNVWISTWGDGIFEYDSNFTLLHHYIHNNNNPTSFGEPLNRAWCFAQDNKGRIWIGCQYGMLSVFDTATKKFTNVVVPEFNGATVMHEIKTSNAIWFGLFSGLIAKLDETTGKIIVFKDVFKNTLKQVSPVDGICVDYAGNIWWSPGANGIREFNEEKNIVTDSVFYPLHLSSPVFINDSVMIGGTDTKGFFILNINNKAAAFFNTSNGLSANDVFGAIASAKNKIWIIANDGIHLLNLRTKKISEFSINDGIRDHELQGPFYQLKNGVILFAAKSGIVYFNPNEIKIKSAPQSICITDFTVNNRNYVVDSLLQHKNISLTHNQNVVTIGYASLSFNGRTAYKYYYQLSGVDNDWVAADERRSVTYANLSPGNYIFKVRAQNADGIFTKKITTLSIIIHPPWWQTWWAYLLWVSIAGCIVFVIYTYRKRNRQALDTMRQKIATDLHDDIGSTLNSISVYSEIAGKQLQSNPENAKSILSKMGVASRSMIDIMSDIVWAVHPKNDQFENVLQRMQYFAGELLSGKNILLQFDVDDKAKNIKLPMEKRKNFYLIFKEAITNAYKYSNSDKLHVKIFYEGNILSLCVFDYGNGFETRQNFLGGNGLKNMQLRAKEIDAVLKINSTKFKGTVI